MKVATVREARNRSGKQTPNPMGGLTTPFRGPFQVRARGLRDAFPEINGHRTVAAPSPRNIGGNTRGALCLRKHRVEALM